MRKVLFLLLLPAFFTSSMVISTERTSVLNSYKDYYDSLPSNPNVYQETPTYTNEKLEKVTGKLLPNQTIKISQLQLNKAGVPVFKLSNGLYVKADKGLIYDDKVLSQENVSKTMWLNPDFTVYEQPYVNGVKSITTNLKAYSSVKISQIAVTNKAKYAKIDGKGWVELSSLSETDNRMEKVQELLISRYNKSDYSIYVKQLDTGKTAGINPDKEMYAASVAKLPILYYAQKQIDEGKYSLSDTFKYIQAVNDYSGSYITEGSGSIAKKADNKEYSIQDLISHITKESDNAATNILGYYMTNQSDKTYQSAIAEIAGKKWDVEKRDASARMAGNIMEAIYKQDGMIIDALSQTNFDNQRISKDIQVKVAHKIGDAYDFKHDVAIVYADSPFVISIFTNHSSYDTISQIADDVYGVLK